MSAAVDAKSFLSAVDELPELRPFPVSATRLIQTSNDPDSCPRDLAAIIRTDPALSVNLLQVANSAIYGFAGQIRTVDHAVVVLGVRSVRNLAVAMAAATLFQQESGAAEECLKLWSHSLGCATLARMLASKTKLVPPDEAFLAGIVHDVGKLIFYDLVPDQYSKVISNSNSRTILEHEGNGFGADHQQVGLMCAEQWGLPEEINQAICFHHNPEQADLCPDLVALISLSNGLAAAWGVGPICPGEDESELVQSTSFKISAEDLAEIHAAVHSEFKLVAASMT